MNSIKDLPFNVKILEASEKRLLMTRPTTSTAIHSDIEGGFDENGLYSTLTFGNINSPERGKLFSYIPLNTTLIHPFVFRELIKINRKYEDLLNKKKTFLWDEEEMDFIASTEEEADSGYGFFMKHYMDIKFKENDSNRRQLRIDLLNKFRKDSLMKNHLIIPAELRDISTDDLGRETEDEINPLYRKLIAISKSIVDPGLDENNPLYDNSRIKMQETMEEIFDLLYRLVTGKQGFIQRKFARRRVFDGTRNVITSMDTSSDVMNGPKQIKAMDTQFGLMQVSRGILPLMVNLLKTNWLNNVVHDDYEYAKLIDPKTLRSTESILSAKSLDNWTSAEGLENQIISFQYVSKRHKPVMIDGKYIGLIYQDNSNFKLFGDISELPETFDRDKVRPITWGELFYHSIYQRKDDIIAVVTRYPITGEGSIYPCHAYIKTTTDSMILTELNDNWEIDENSKTYYEWPNVLKSGRWIDSMAPSPIRLSLLGADFDGDMMSATFLVSNEAVEEGKKALSSKKALLDSSNNLFHGIVTDLAEWTLLNLTG